MSGEWYSPERCRTNFRIQIIFCIFRVGLCCVNDPVQLCDNVQERPFLPECPVVVKAQPICGVVLLARPVWKISCLDLDHQHICRQVNQNLPVRFAIASLPNCMSKPANCRPYMGRLVVKTRTTAGFPAHPGRPLLDFIMGQFCRHRAFWNFLPGAETNGIQA